MVGRPFFEGARARYADGEPGKPKKIVGAFKPSERKLEIGRRGAGRQVPAEGHRKKGKRTACDVPKMILIIAPDCQFEYLDLEVSGVVSHLPRRGESNQSKRTTRANRVASLLPRAALLTCQLAQRTFHLRGLSRTHEGSRPTFYGFWFPRVR